MSNFLTSGAGAPVSPSPEDQDANPPTGGNALSPPPPGPAPVPGHILSQEDQAAAQFGKLKEAKAKMDGTLREFEKLAAFGDTVSMDDVVEAAAGLVALGVPAVACASLLASAPEQQSQLAGWVQEQIGKIGPKAEQLDAAYAQGAYTLGLTSLKSILAHSAEDHFSKSALARMPVQGNA